MITQEGNILKIKKTLAVLIIIIFILFTISFVTYLIDSYRIDNNYKPIFIVHKDQLNDGGTTVYYGIGYQLITWKMLNPDMKSSMSGMYYLVGIEKHYIGGFNINLEPKVELMESSE